MLEEAELSVFLCVLRKSLLKALALLPLGEAAAAAAAGDCVASEAHWARGETAWRGWSETEEVGR